MDTNDGFGMPYDLETKISQPMAEPLEIQLNNLEIELLNQFRKIDSDYKKLGIIDYAKFKANDKKALVVQLPIVFNKRKHKNKDIQAKKKAEVIQLYKTF